ncbi:hypothetical protein D9619_003141 [Psilocybe cf. subviscida]|uniref:Uncharacterized protein n=1 Tax=Psilocybe cf. subviscida TaxID=2480587 RepID=A0A8H5EU64_9AGAR|nr:hypothetical protein D9619_003141 [Psilocybe cf. subviscida]
MFRSRSQPSSSSNDVVFRPTREAVGRMSSKRSHPWLSGPSSGSPGLDYEVDTQRRRGKRQRCESSSNTTGFQSRQWQDQHERHQAEPALKFATTSAQFDLFARPERSSSAKNRSQGHTSRGNSNYQPAPHPADHGRLRSTAFWDLRQSIAKNGEGFIRRMREYERSRSKPQNHQKAKDAEKRGRKRLPLRNKKSPARSPSSDASDDDNDDDILICSGESANHIFRPSFTGQRARCLDAMDVDLEWSSQSQGPKNEDANHTTSLKDTKHTTKCPETQPDDNDTTSSHDEQLFSDHIDSCLSESSPSLSTSSCGSPHSSVFSIPLPPSTLSDNESDSVSLPSTGSDKILAAVNLALANGAGSINDYSSLWEHNDHYDSQSYDSGDLWH